MKTSITRIFAGLGIVLLGGLLLLNSLNIQGFDNILGTWWPLFAVGTGLLVWLSDARNYLWALLLIGFGAFYQLNNLDIININPWQVFWPVVIIVVGLSVVFQRATRPKVDPGNDTDLSAILGGVEQVSASEDYTGGKITAIMGGATIDLRKVVIKKEATLDVYMLMSGVELWVPENVVVKSSAAAILGGIENKSHAKEGENTPVLYVTGQVVMAGIEIKN